MYILCTYLYILAFTSYFTKITGQVIHPKTGEIIPVRRPRRGVERCCSAAPDGHAIFFGISLTHSPTIPIGSMLYMVTFTINTPQSC